MIGAFRIERPIATGATGSVYEATQLSLRRAVALRLIAPGHFTTPDQLVRFDHQQRLTASLHHPNLVPYYEVGEWEGGRFIATRLIRGKTLADLRARGSPPAAESLEPLAGALQAAHAAGLTHGRISDENILIEANGTPFLADLGLGRRGSPEEDAEALAAVVSRLPAQAAATRRDRSWRALRLGLVGLAGVAALALVLAANGGEDSPAPIDAPPSPPNTTVVGSELPPVAVRPLGCREDPSANTPACTFAQTRLDGRAVTVRRAGVIRAWAVRGASGDLALQVIRARGGKSFVVGFSQPERLTDTAPRSFPANVGVRAGDQIGVRLAPGAHVGASSRSPRSALVRWDGGLTAWPQAEGTTLSGELMLRVDLELGARPDAPRQLRGEAAASAPPGRRLAESHVALSSGRAARVVVVGLPGGIAIDLVSDRRITRLEVPDADRDGELRGLEQNCGQVGVRGFCLRWRNPGEEVTLVHEYRVGRNGRIKLIG